MCGKDYFELKIKRYLNLIFDSKITTPTADETAMYLAASAAGNSACLSRQVGAALTDEKGEMISVGWNDVPKYGGDLYRSKPNDITHKHDKRCVYLGEGCWNDKEKNIISDELVKILIESKVIPKASRKKAFDKIRNSKIKSIVEFSRAIHAEMHAIILGSQTGGSKVKNGKLYITTYPCHICARHIIVAGIKEVYYIEPYRKSLTTKLHKDAITENEKDKNKVKILMFDGVAPNKYMQLFKMHTDSRKKQDGSGMPIERETYSPKHSMSLESLPVLEGQITKELKAIGLEKR